MRFISRKQLHFKGENHKTLHILIELIEHKISLNKRNNKKSASDVLLGAFREESYGGNRWMRGTKEQGVEGKAVWEDAGEDSVGDWGDAVGRAELGRVAETAARAALQRKAGSDVTLQTLREEATGLP